MSEPEEFTMMCGAAVDALARGAMQQHLAGCMRCQRKSAELAGAGKSAFSRQPKVPADLTPRFLDRARAEGIPLRIPAKTTRIPLNWKLAVPALALLLVVTLSLTLRNRRPEFRRAEIPTSEVASTNESPTPRLRLVAVRERRSTIHRPAQPQSPFVKVTDGSLFRQPSQRPAPFLAGYDQGISRYHSSLLLASASSGEAFPETDGFSFQARAAEFPSQATPHIDWQRMRLPQLLSVAERTEAQ